MDEKDKRTKWSFIDVSLVVVNIHEYNIEELEEEIFF